MKKVFCCVFVFILAIIAGYFIGEAIAAQVTFEWNPAEGSNPSGYAIFQRSFQQSYGLPIWEGAETTATITVPDDKETAYVCRAYVFGSMDLEGNMPKIWSGDSNEVVFTPTNPDPPAPPQNFIQRLIQAILNWFNGLFG